MKNLGKSSMFLEQYILVKIQISKVESIITNKNDHCLHVE